MEDMTNREETKPSLEAFRRAVRAMGGNLSKVAESFGVSRGTIYNWRDSDPEFMAAIRDERVRLYDESLQTSRIVALGIPKYDYERDANGELMLDDKGKPVRKMVGWAVPPDPNMLRYFMNLYGRYDKIGYTDEDGAAVPVVQEGINIRSWIELRNEKKEQ